MTGKRRKFTVEFKAEAVRLVALSGKPLAQIARELGLNEQVLRHWKKQAAATDGSGLVPDRFAQEEEIRRLRRELLRVTEERDILYPNGHKQKATAFFANQSR
jgi:transposase